MALFKVFRGDETNLPVAMNDGWAYFCTDTGNFYIDWADGENLVRTQINSNYANKLRYMDGEELVEINPQDIALKSDIPEFGALATKDSVSKSDLATDIQASLGKADTALQSYTETDPTVPAWAKASTKPSYTASEVGLGNVDNVKQYSASNPPPYPVKSVNGKTGAVTVNEVPSCSTSDNGKILGVVDGAAAWEATTTPDWNQNDATQPDYINNRTHYDAGSVNVAQNGSWTLSTSVTGLPSGMKSGCLVGTIAVASSNIVPVSYTIGNMFGPGYAGHNIGEVVCNTTGPAFNYCVDAIYTGGVWNLYFYLDSTTLFGATPDIPNVVTVAQLNKKYLPMNDIISAVKASYPSAEGASF